MLGVHKEGQERFSKIQAICNEEKKKKKKKTEKKLRSALVLNYIRAGLCASFKKATDLGISQPPTVTTLCWKGSDIE